MHRRIIKTAAMTMALAMMMTVPTFAGWQSNATGWWWQNPDNTYPVNKWEWLDGNGDGIAECYYFDASGYMLTNTKTPDGSQVDANGAWTANGAVQTKAVATGTTKELTYQSDTNSEYIVKRVGVFKTRSVEGGKIFGVFDYSNVDMSTQKAEDDYCKSRNYKSDFELFCPDAVEFPNCVLVQVELDGNTVVKATPVWIDSLEWHYGGFGNNSEKSEYIGGRLEWRGYEESDPDYGLELQIQLTAESKERAYEMYPDLIVDYYLDPYEQK